MTEDVHRELQKHLDKMPIGYPPTESGVEIRVLKHLFTPEEAQLALKLNFQVEPLIQIYKKVESDGTSIEGLEQMLDDMYFKGLINRWKQKFDDGEVKHYSNAFLVVGMFEYQLGKLTKEFVEDFHEYLEEAFFEDSMAAGIPQLRTIPIGQTIEHEQGIASYDDLRSIVKNAGGPFAVQECICRQGQEVLGNPCQKTKLVDSCLLFRTNAKIAIEKGHAKEISEQELLKVLEDGEKNGLVLQPGNSQRPGNICMCCGCCCEILTNTKRFQDPARLFATNFIAVVDEDVCSGCGTCETRCNMEAVQVGDDIAEVDINRCIGCGVCVPTCTTEAMSLQKKDKETIPPINTVATYTAIMMKRAELSKEK